MAANLYPLSFLISLGVLTGWFYYREDEKRSDLLRKIFFVALILFGSSWLMASQNWATKFTALGRELAILAIVPLFLSLFRKNKVVFVALLIGTLLGMDQYYFEPLKATFQDKLQQEIGGGAEIQSDPNGEFLVEILEGHQLAEIEPLLKKYRLEAQLAFHPIDKEQTDLDDYYLINTLDNDAADLPKVKEALQNNNAVEWVEMNEQYALSPMELMPQRKTPILEKKYGLNDPGLEFLWGFEAIDMASLFHTLQKVKPQKRALIAILDTGVDAGHEDIQANFKSVRAKYDNDPAGHGTHCAGIAAAVSNNGVGVASFSQTNDYVQVTSIKVLSGGGYGTQKMIIDGILEAADAGADVISLSLGGPSNDSRQRAYQKAVDYANKKGAIVVVAAGNSNRNAKEFAPANTPGVICVSAVDTVLNRASFSNKVEDLEMGVAAPGVSIYSTYPKGQYQTLNGTSMATPYVAGLLGVMKSLNPSLKTKEAFQILDESGVNTGSSKETGHLIQAGAAVRLLMKRKDT